uniref:Replication-associated protein n=1 Tax=Red panda feces-associated circular DNA virus 5 TaxID=2863980 RepID=A0A8K1HIN8_9VIRU|nr:replication-associated protein [Red panda feces-associated circular DNA virus 5]
MTSRNWCFTINNPTTSDILVSEQQVKFLICTLECGESGTIHYQGYLELKTNRNLNQVKALFRDTGTHLERRMGTRTEAITYCLKTIRTVMNSSTSSLNSLDLTEYCASLIGNQTESSLKGLIVIGFDGSCQDFLSTLQSKRKVQERLATVKEKLLSGSNDLDIANEDFELWVKYHKAFSHYRLLNAKPRSTKTKVFVVQGPTGTGKSHWARQQDPHAYWKPRNNWWDGYVGQSTVVIDEFYGWLPFDLLLRLCDEYPLQVECKGGSINFNAKRLIITTNNVPVNWYSNVYFQAFIRRVNTWIVIPEMGNINTYSDFNSVMWAIL